MTYKEFKSKEILRVSSLSNRNLFEQFTEIANGDEDYMVFSKFGKVTYNALYMEIEERLKDWLEKKNSL